MSNQPANITITREKTTPKDHGDKSLAVRFPTVAAEWDYTAVINEGLTLSQIMSGSDKKRAWVCSKAGCGYKWEAQVKDRTNKNRPSGCPACAGRVIIPGVNDLATRNPFVAAEWDYEAVTNEGLTPAQIMSGSDKKRAWVCSKTGCGHKWETRVSHRTNKSRPTGCPECSKRGLLSKRGLVPKEDSIAVKNLSVAAEWDYASVTNEGLTPSQIMPGSHKKLGWVCSKAGCGHKWETEVASRTNKNRPSGCPACAGRVIIPGVNDLATRNPSVAAEWDYETVTNEGLTPSQIMPGSGKKLGWVCSKAGCGHKWEAQVKNRTKKVRPTGCPECSRRGFISREDSIAVRNPSVAAEWDYEAVTNEGLTPSQIMPGSRKKRAWVCSKAGCGHKWEARVNDRTHKNHPTGCPACIFRASRSAGEAALANYVQSILPTGLNVSHSDRTVLDGQEVDIHVEGLGLGIEYNGVFFHSEAKVDASYHESKFLRAKANGIRLIQIWEDEYVLGETVPARRRREANRKMEATKSLLANLISTSMDSFDDSCSDSWWFDDNHSVEELKKFMDVHTTEGFISSFNHSVVLKNDESQACAVMTLNVDRKSRVAEVVQYASSYPTIQAYSSMIQHVKFIHSNLTAIHAHMDNCFPADDIYVNAGFIETEHISASFKYTKDRQRFNVTEYSKKKYETDPNLYRIWDAGKTLWVKTF